MDAGIGNRQVRTASAPDINFPVTFISQILTISCASYAHGEKLEQPGRHPFNIAARFTIMRGGVLGRMDTFGTRDGIGVDQRQRQRKCIVRVLRSGQQV